MQVCTNIQWNPVKAFANGKLSNMLNLWRSLNPKYQSVYETQFVINILWKLSNIDFNVSATCCDRVKGWVEYDLTIWLISFQRAALNLKHLVAVKHFVECWNGEDFERFLPLVGMEECNAWRPRPPLPSLLQMQPKLSHCKCQQSILNWLRETQNLCQIDWAGNSEISLRELLLFSATWKWHEVWVRQPDF